MIWRRDAEPLPEGRIGLDSALALFGDGVFSSLRVAGGRAWFVNLHLERIAASARLLRLEAPSGVALRRAIDAACADADPERVYRLRVMLVPESSNARQTSVFTGLSEHVEAPHPVGLAISTYLHPGLAAGKTLSWQWSRAAMREAVELGVDDVILTDGNGLVETATGALAVRVGGQWGVVERPGATPLQSTTVAALRSVGRLGERHLVLRAQVESIEAAMVLSAIRLATPVRSIDGRILDDASKASEELRNLLAMCCDGTSALRYDGSP